MCHIRSIDKRKKKHTPFVIVYRHTHTYRLCGKVAVVMRTMTLIDAFESTNFCLIELIQAIPNGRISSKSNVV